MPPALQLLGQWDDASSTNPEVELDCLLPTGIIIQLTVRKDGLLADIKEELWRASQNYPLYSALKDKNTYVFMCINQRAEKEELVDEGKRLCDVKPFQPLLKVVEKKGDKAEIQLNFQISNIIGKGLREFDAIKNSEVSDFRVRMKHLCRNIAKERDSKDWLARAKYLYPQKIANSAEIPWYILNRLNEHVVLISIRKAGTSANYTFQVPLSAMPAEVIELMGHKISLYGQELGDPSDYVLKVLGREEYLFADHPLTQYYIVRKNLMKGEITQLILVPRDSLLVNEPPKIPPRPGGHTVPPVLKPRKSKMKSISLWDLTNPYQITVNLASNVSCDISTKLFLRAGIYHGPQMMCGSLVTKEVTVNDSCADWHELLTFDIELHNLPRMARLCLALFAVYDKRVPKKGTVPRKVRQGKTDVAPLSWVNIPVFDYTGVLRTGNLMLYMWPIPDDAVLSEELLNPIGSVEFNPNAEEAIGISLTCANYDITLPILYPLQDKVLEVARQNKDPRSEQFKTVMQEMKASQLNGLRAMLDMDPLHVLHEQEKELIWRLRYECQYHFPNSLSTLLNCVEWNDHIQVSLMQDLLRSWPPLSPLEALELLDFNYADNSVRKFAVKCLKDISDYDLCQYLLQLVQVLKYESYIESDLVEFLLQRALRNQHVGHIFFWLLRSEMHIPSVSVRYGLILEAYCHGSISHVKLLTKQAAALEKLSRCCLAIQDFSAQILREGAREEMRKMLQQNSFAEALSDLPSSLDPAFRLKELRLGECKFMDSKKRPLWLVWENLDTAAPDVFIMYKKGDDLRQDMLTLQILRIIESIWQEEGLDLRMNAYGCLATGHEEGLIEIVLNSDTIANIQKKHSALAIKSAFNKEGLYKWLQSKNPEPDKLNRALEEFTLSCAGYCVATYVLGIGDRHSDNIMLKENGQMFHIDFGHFLGNFKSKMGLKRERVPFVLTSDFVYLIRRGPDNNDAHFKRFRSLCEKAFLSLRSKSHFLITLFMMMMNTGIPQLSSIKAIHFLKNTLQPHIQQDAALQNFQDKFNEALKSGWKTQLNFAAHNLTRDNK